MVSTKKLTRYQNRYSRYSTRLATYQAAGKAMKASKVLLKMQKLAKKIQKFGGRVQAVGAVQVGDGFRATGAITVGAAPGVRKTYQVQLSSGAIRYQAPSGRVVTLGYTPAKAKKMYRTKRRRKRLSSRDKAILAAIAQNPQAAPALSLMM